MVRMLHSSFPCSFVFLLLSSSSSSSSSVWGREVLPHLPEAKSTRINDLVNQPFVPRDFLMPERATIVDVTSNDDFGLAVKEAIRSVLNRDAAAVNETFTQLSINYLGKEDSGLNDTRLFVKTYAVLCPTTEGMAITLDAFGETEKCGLKECNLELAQWGEEAGFVSLERITLVNLMCREAKGCLACREDRCPIVDVLQTRSVISGVDLGLEVCHSISPPSGTKCVNKYYEVAGLRSYTHMGCWNEYDSSEENGTNDDDNENDNDMRCDHDMHNYKHECICRGSLCNHFGRPTTLPETYSLIRQLRAHMDSELRSIKQCGQDE